MQSIEVEAKTVEEAISIACDQLKATKDMLRIEVLEESSKLISLFSGKKSRIRATVLKPVDDADETVEKLKSILETIVLSIDSGASVQVSRKDDEIIFNIVSDGSGIFIGKKGQTLEAFQYLINKIRINKFKEIPHINVDSESYRSRHIDSLVNLAQRLSEKAKQRKGPVTTSLLRPGDRRIIHMALKKDTELTTWSKGEGTLKKVIIAPRQPS